MPRLHTHRFSILALLLLISTAPACAQTWFPTHIGDKWLYQYDTRDDNGNGRAHLSRHTWKTEETTVAVWTIPEGTLIAIKVRLTEGESPAWPVNPDRAYLLHGDCLYQDVSWDSATHQLTADFRQGLGTYLSPDYCFPLALRKTWGAPHGLPDWAVARPQDAKDWKVAGVQQNTFHITSISAYPGAGITSDRWYEKGVGIVRQVEIHHGTIGERRVRLLHFEPRP